MIKCTNEMLTRTLSENQSIGKSTGDCSYKRLIIKIQIKKLWKTVTKVLN